MPRRQSKFLFACARLARQTTHRNPKTDSTLRFRPLGGQVHMLPQEDLDAMKSLLGDVGDEVTKGQPAVREMLSTVRAAAAKY